MGKERLDKLVVERGLCESRSQAQAFIMDGKVRVKGQVVTKPGTLVDTEEPAVEVTGVQKYVSRGGLKLEKALQVFLVNVQGRGCIDVGASTGGFTDCLLQHEAAHVTAVDVGYGQLDWKLRQNTKVTTLEKTNIRDVQPVQVTGTASLGVVDTSFISLKKVLPSLAELLSRDGKDPEEMIALLKPQFEYRDYLKDSGFRGVVRGREHHQAILWGVLGDLFALLPGWSLVGLDFSPITGPKGNIEFLLHWIKDENDVRAMQEDALVQKIEAVLEQAYRFHSSKQPE